MIKQERGDTGGREASSECSEPIAAGSSQSMGHYDDRCRPPASGAWPCGKSAKSTALNPAKETAWLGSMDVHVRSARIVQRASQRLVDFGSLTNPNFLLPDSAKGQ
jgi:hypothetical protein